MYSDGLLCNQLNITNLYISWLRYIFLTIPLTNEILVEKNQILAKCRLGLHIIIEYWEYESVYKVRIVLDWIIKTYERESIEDKIC